MAAGQRKHLVAPGEDSYAYLSTTHYGDPAGAGLIRSANPGVADPPPVGKYVLIPDRPPLVPPPVGVSADVGPDECELRVNGRRFRYWKSVSLSRTFDAFDTLDFTAPMARAAEFRDTFTPLGYQDVEALIGGRRFFKGTVMSPSAALSADTGGSFSVGAYSRAGVLGDCTPPASAYPLQFKGASLPVIAQALLRPWGLVVTVGGSAGEPFRRVRLKASDKVLSFLTGLAKQRKVFLSSTPDGGLLIREGPTVGTPVARLGTGRRPGTDWGLSTDPKKVFSHLTVLRKKARRVNSSAHTVVNDALVSLGVLRPDIVRNEDTNSAAELPAVATALAGRMLAGAVTWTVDLPTWRDEFGAVWEPGTTVHIESAPDVFISRPTDLIIRAVQLSRTDAKTTAKLEMVLPGAFSGVLPAVFPWSP